MRVLIVAGGTGGHVLPALRIYDEIKKRGKDAIILTLEKNKGVGKGIFGDRRITFYKAKEFSLSPSFFLTTLTSFFKSLFIILKNKINTVITTGGYPAFPALLASILLRKKIFLIEQNAIPGKITKLFDRLSERVFCSFEEGVLRTKNGLYVGPIVREEITKANEYREKAYEFFSLEEDIPTFLIIGGSQGSKKINETIKEFIERFGEKYQFIWITGDKFYDGFKSLDKENIRIFPFLKDMHLAYSISHIVISRAGASTLQEIMYLQKRAVLIPYPYATYNHQYYNAVEALKLICGEIITEDELDPFKLRNVIHEIAQKKCKEKPLQDGAEVIVRFILYPS